MEALHPTDPSAIGDYRLLGRLGGGGNGPVYLGATRTGQLVAVKVIRAEIAADTAFRAQVRARGSRGRARRPALDGGRHRCRRRGGGPVACHRVRTRPIAAGGGQPGWTAAGTGGGRAGEAVGRGDRRDPRRWVGPSPRDARQRAHVSRRPGPDRPRPRSPVRDRWRAHPTTVAGTHSYLSPEQIRGRPARPPSDVFSLGATLAYAVTARGPFDAGGSDGVVERVLAASPDLAGAPPPLHDLILGCLAKRPARRPTPAELTKALAAAATGADGPSGGWQPPTGQLATAPASDTGGSWVRRSREGDILARLIMFPLIGIAAVPAMVFPFGPLVAVFMLSVPRSSWPPAC